MIGPTNIVAFDVETSGVKREFALQPHRATVAHRLANQSQPQAWLTTCAHAGDGLAVGTVRPDQSYLRKLLNEFIDDGKYVVCWNAPFDVAWLLAYGLRDEVYKIKWLDGMLLYRHVVNAPRYTPEGNVSLGLKSAVAAFYPDEAGYEEGIDFTDESAQAVRELLDYNIKDCEFTYRLACKFIGELPRATLRAALIEARCIPLVAEATLNGISIDTTAALELKDKLDTVIKTSFVQLRLTNSVTQEILASPQQLSKMLYTTWGLPIPKLTPTGAASTDKEALHKLALSDDRARLVHLYREANYNSVKFCDGPLESVAYNGDAKTRPAARIFGTYTGRMSYSSKQGKGVNEVPIGVALHQWKRHKDFRKLIKPPEGYTLLEFDFAGQEFRWMAVESGDPTMLKLCMPGEDAHAFMGARVAHMNYRQLVDEVAKGVPGAKEKRQLGKVANLSLQYRTSASKLQTVAETQHNIIMRIDEARSIHATYLTTYGRVRPYWHRQIDRAKRMGYVETLSGRRVLLGNHMEWGDQAWSHESTAINFPIQGIGADQKYLALLVLRDCLNKFDGRFYFELHDGIFIVVPDNKAEAAAHELKIVLSNLPYKKAWELDLPIQFPVDAKLGPSWGELKEIM